ncbi:MAG TPA: hypothetical protein VFQ16_17020 [Burkholderiaceae bacterium]|nr:hypothetical protein [Burkholderiaceae bacterium]
MRAVGRARKGAIDANGAFADLSANGRYDVAIVRSSLLRALPGERPQ